MRSNARWGLTAAAVLAVLLAGQHQVGGQPTKSDLWKGSAMDAMVEQTRVECSQHNDEIACMKFKALNLLDQLYRKDNFKISENVEVTRNSYPVDEMSGRSGDAGFLESLRGYLASHDLTFKMPFGSTVKVSSRNIDDDQLSFDVKFGPGAAGRSSSASEETTAPEPRRSKLKKVIVPILVFVLLKAMTLIPLAIGVLGLKAWNALQLSFFSFVVSVGLAIFQLCKKIAADSHHAAPLGHGPWDYPAQRAFTGLEPSRSQEARQAAQRLAYGL